MDDAPKPVVGQVTILNREGFHSRPVMRFVELAQSFNARIRVSAADGSKEVDGKSAMELMLLGAAAGTTLRISADGPDAESAIQALAHLVKARFKPRSNP